MIKKSFKNYPLFPFLLPLFFVLHGLAENFFVINLADAVVLFLSYAFAAAILFFFFRFLYKDTAKAALITFSSFAFYFFFGAFQDFVKNLTTGFFSRYSVLLPLFLLFYAFLLFWVKQKPVSSRLVTYLNAVFLLLILIDLVNIIRQVVAQKQDVFAIEINSNLAKPNVYLLVLDEYAGAEQLEKTFQFHNDAFLDSLSSIGFSVRHNSTSNYHDTPFSMASLLSMSYLNELKDYAYTDENLNYCYRKIYRSDVVSGFKSLGYTFVNCSIFDFEGESASISKTFLKSGTELITAQTLWSRVKRDLYYNFILNHWQGSSLYRDYLMQDFYHNELLYKKTIQQANVRHARPMFVYTHLLMPHFPYYFNATGEWNSQQLLHPQNMADKQLYLGYLQYVNEKILELVKHIAAKDKTAIILLLSDHGFRYANDGDVSYATLSAVYHPIHLLHGNPLPATNVNVFRQLFNDLFLTKLPLLPDKRFK